MGRLSSKISSDPARGQRKRKLGESLREQSGLGAAIGPTKARKDRPGNVGQPISTSGAQRTRTRNPQAKMSSYQLPPGPRGDTPSGTGHRGNRTGEMRSAYWQTPAGKKEIKRRNAAARRRNVAPWRREAQKLS